MVIIVGWRFRVIQARLSERGLLQARRCRLEKVGRTILAPHDGASQPLGEEKKRIWDELPCSHRASRMAAIYRLSRTKLVIRSHLPFPSFSYLSIHLAEEGVDRRDGLFTQDHSINGRLHLRSLDPLTPTKLLFHFSLHPLISRFQT